MKHLLRKLFFWDAPAQGAFFGLIALLAWLWLVSMEMICDVFIKFRLPEMFRTHTVCAYCLLWTILLMGLYFVGIRVVSLYRLCLKGKGFFHRHRYGVLLASLWAHWLILARLDLQEFFLPALLLHIVICVAVHPGAKRWERCSLCLLWGTAAISLGLIFAYSVYPFYVVIGKLSDGPESIVQYHDIFLLTEIRDGLRTSGYGWSLVAFLAYLCVLLYCLLSGQILARFGNVPKRSLFGRRVFAVLGLCVAAYVVFSLLALLEERNYRRVLSDLEGYFGKPLTNSALEQEYYGERKPDPDFWNQLQKSSKSIRQDWDSHLCITGGYYSPFENHLFMDEWDKDIRCKWKEFFQKQAETGVIHSLLDGDIPPAPRDEYQRPFFWDYCYFDDLGGAQDCLPVEGWLLRFAMEDQDGRASESILAKMEKLCRYVRRDSFGNWAENFRLNALLRFVETGLADDSWLDRQIASLDNLEKELPDLEKEWIYQNATFYAIRNHDMAHHLEVSQARGADLAKLRIFFPLIWWRAGYQARVLGTCYQCDSFSKMKLPAGHSDSFYTNFRNAYRVTNRINSLLVSIRGVRTLLEAERVRLHTGTYPNAMANVPIDPFTNQPLQYSIGLIEIDVNVIVPHKEEEKQADSSDSAPDYSCTCGCDCSEGCKCKQSGEQIYADVRQEKRRVDAVQVFSPGSNAEKTYDDIRFFIRLNPEKPQ